MKLTKDELINLTSDQKSQKRLYNLLYAELFHIPKRYRKTQQLADDIFNDAMLKFFNSLAKVSVIDNVFSYASKIIHNTTIDCLRKEIKIQKKVTYPVELPELISTADSVLDHLETDELFECIHSLAQNQLSVFSLFEIDGYSHKEISQMLDISEGNSKYLLHMAKKSLRIKLSEYHIH